MLGRMFGWHGADMAKALAPAEARASLEDPAQPLTLKTIESIGMASAGVHVTEESAVRYTWVYACVKVISQTIAMLPCKVLRNLGNGGRDTADDNPLYYLLHDEPNTAMTSYIWRELLMRHVLLWGNAYALIEMTQGGKVLALHPLMPWRVTPRRDPATRGVFYEYNLEGGGIERLPSQEVLHFPGPGFDGLIGKSPIRDAREAIGLGLAAEQFGARFIGNDMRPGVVIEHPAALSDKARTNIQASFKAEHGGLANKNKIRVLEEGMKLHEVGIPPTDAQYIDLRKMQRTDICAIYRVPPSIAGDHERSTFANVEHLDIAFAKHCIAPWIKLIEQELNRKLFRSSRYFAEFTMDGLLRGDYATRAEGHAKLVNAGIMMANEARKDENLPPAAGGDVLRFPVNVASEDERKQQAKQKAAPAAAPAKENPDDDKDDGAAEGDRTKPRAA